MKILLDTNVIGEIARPDSPYRANLLSRFNNFSMQIFYLNARFDRVQSSTRSIETLPENQQRS